MASKQQATTTSKFPKPYGIRLTKRYIPLATAGLLVLAVVVWIAIAQIQRQLAIHQQQQRFDSIRSIQRAFETNMRQSLGSSLTELKEDDSCYHLAQQEFHFLGTNGVLNCGMEIQGVTNELPGVAASGNGAWYTSLQIAAAAKDALQHSGLAFTRFGLDSIPKYDGAVIYGDNYNLYGQLVRCDLSAYDRYDPVPTKSVKTVHSDQLYFTFNCYQSASKNFFKFVYSPLDIY